MSGDGREAAIGGDHAGNLEAEAGNIAPRSRQCRRIGRRVGNQQNLRLKTGENRQVRGHPDRASVDQNQFVDVGQCFSQD